ncbi:MAG: hypothetical protein IJG84_03450 [Kiritimatiellae bacterium]|nr:hypothetical protein [Kiritimatiellia bacterium]
MSGDIKTETLAEIIAEARDKYTVHNCGECNRRKWCDYGGYSDDNAECKQNRESIMLLCGIEDGYFRQLLDRIEATAKRAYNEIDTAVCSIEDASHFDIDDVRKAMERTIGDYYE